MRKRPPGARPAHACRLLARVRGRCEAGSALLLAMMLLVVLGSMSAGLVLLVGTESQIARHYQVHARLRYAAEAGLELGMQRLRQVGDWSQVLQSIGGGAQAPGVGGGGMTPWRLLDRRRLGALVGRGRDTGETFDVWVADDDDDRDGDPSRDSNGRLTLRAEARGVDGGRYVVRASVVRAGDLEGGSVPRVIAWHADEE